MSAAARAGTCILVVSVAVISAARPRTATAAISTGPTVGAADDNSSLSVLDYGAVGDGVHDDAPAVQKCIDSLPNDGGVVRFPKGVYGLGATLRLTNRQVRLIGDSYFSVLLIPLVELPLGTVSIRASDCEVNNLNVRTKGPRGVGVLVQGAAYAMIRNVQFLSDKNGQGVAVVFDDRNAPDGKLVPGSYTHTIENCYFGRPWKGAGIFNRSITTAGTSGGINACQIRGSHFIGDVAIEWNAGGGNFFSGNVFQSFSGTYQKPAGSAILLNGGGSATVALNYVERYESVVSHSSTDRNPRDTSSSVSLNEYDNVVSVMQSLTNETFGSAWSVGADGVVAESLGGLMTARGAVGTDGLIDTSTRAVTITTLPRGVRELSLSTDHARPGQLFTLFCVAGGDAALHPVVLAASDTAVFGEHGSNASGAGSRMLFGPQAMAHAAQLQGSPLYYTATFMFTPCAPPAPEPTGSHQTYCTPGDGAVCLCCMPRGAASTLQHR